MHPSARCAIQFDNRNQDQRKRHMLDEIEMPPIGDHEHFVATVAQWDLKLWPPPANVGCKCKGDKGENPRIECCDRDGHFCLSPRKSVFSHRGTGMARTICLDF